MAQNDTSFWKKAGAYVGVGVLIAAASFGGASFVKNEPIDQDALADNIFSKFNFTDTTVDIDMQNDVEAIKMKIFEDDAWEAEAEIVATDDWDRRDYKEVFDFLEDEYGDIDDKDDIDYVKVRDTFFSSMDSEDGDGTVVQEVKVRYESKEGDKINRYLTITTDLEEGDVEDQEFAETA